jgi:NAD(P)-dependent dehydrogenase (short-subunit alcohol dehydrogenase family)
VSTVQKVAIVTGAGTGIGKSAALALLKDGYCVALVGRRKELLDRTAADSGAGERALALPADLARPEAVKGVFAAVKEKWGRLDVLFNNAGMGAPAIPMEDLTYEQWKAVVDVNLTALPVHAGGDPHHEGADAARAAASSTTARSRPMRRARTRRPTPPPSTRSPGSPSRPRSTAASTTSPAARSTSATPPPK